MNADLLLEKTLFLSHVPCFEELELEILFPLAEKLIVKELLTDEVVFQPGEVPFNLFFVVKGKVLLENKEKKQITYCLQGEYFGDLELFTHTQRQTFATCTENTSLYALPSGVLFAALQESPKLSVKILESYAKRLIALS